MHEIDLDNGGHSASAREVEGCAEAGAWVLDRDQVVSRLWAVAGDKDDVSRGIF